MKTITLSTAIEGYELYAQARHLSARTLEDYRTTFRKFQAFLEDDPALAEISAHDVEAFLGEQEVSKKTVLNYHVGLSALWTWAVKEDLVPVHIVRKVDPPNPEKRAIIPLSEEDVRAMLASLTVSKPYTRPGKKESTHSIQAETAERNRAIIILLLDTGMRATELCDLLIHQVDLQNRRVQAFGKGAKERYIPFSARTGQTLWRYLATRKDSTAGDPLFITKDGNAMTRMRLHKILAQIGERAGVADVHPHRFRHTFAINYLRNGGDPWTLQMLLGHATMEMVRNYLNISRADIDNNHRLASPVDRWRL
jgi:site-specific recombinase XerD